ncbi:MAG: MFS transporter [Caulobacteraceae bacterium]|nr:MFS transporter [Caulobacter sp.]
MNIRPLIGLLGVVIGVSFSELNDQLANIALPDIAGGLGIGVEAASWLNSIYLAGVVLGAVTGPSLAVIYSQRRYLLGAVALVAAAALLQAATTNYGLALGARFLEGVGEGTIIANLIAAALKALQPSIRLYGLIFYAMTATMIPNLATGIAAVWVDVVGDWRFIFLQSLPLAAVSALLIWWGMPQEEPKREMLKSWDWPGAIFGLLGFGAILIFYEEGERYDWFNSKLLSTLALVGGVNVILFIYRELTVPVPLVGMKLLAKRNLLYAATTLILYIAISLSASTVPSDFLQQVHGYRPLQTFPLTLEVGLAQLVLLPFTAWLLDHVWADSRVVSAIGLACIFAACVWGTQINSAWTRDQFYGIQALQAIGAPFVVMPLLMVATNALQKPEEGPLGAALVNAPRAATEAFGAGLLSIAVRWRGVLHEERILDTLGQRRIDLVQLRRLPAAALALTPHGEGPGGPALRALNAAVGEQVATLTALDSYIGFAFLTAVLTVIAIFLPVRSPPPRIALAGG